MMGRSHPVSSRLVGSRLHGSFLMHGDNVAAMRSLLAGGLVGQVRLIYIDPPFATNRDYRRGNGRTAHVSAGNGDALAYSDRLLGQDYLDSLRERLVLLRDLLGDEGSIYLHIDCKIGHYVRVLMDEVFGSHNFRSEIARIKCNPKNFRRKGYGNIKDTILFYSKTGRFLWNEAREPMTKEEIARLFPKVDAAGRRYTTTPLHAPGETRNGPTGQKWRGIDPPAGRHWRCRLEHLERLDKAGMIEWSSTGNPRKVIFADGKQERGKKRQDVWEFKDPARPDYPTQKNLDMLRVIIEASSNPGDLVLDCFCGSGTTLVAAESLGRRWVGIDSSKEAINTAQERLRDLCSPAAPRLAPVA